MNKKVQESIRIKLLKIMLLLIVAIIIFVYISVRTIESNRAHLLQDRDAEQKADLVMTIMEVYTDSMIGTAKDWGLWNETYDYLQGTNPSYESDNLHISSFDAININLVIYYDLLGNIKLQKFYDFEAYEEIEISQNLIDSLDQLAIYQNTASDYFFHGYIYVDESIYFIATSPIANGTDEVSGNLVFGRLIDENVKQYIESIVLFDFNLLESTLDVDEPSSIEYIGNHQLVIRHSFEGMLSDEHTMIEITVETEILDFVQQTIILMTVIILVTGSILAIFSSIIFNNMVFKRLINLSNEIRSITHNSQFSLRVKEGLHQDEITSVALEINFMLDKIGEDEKTITQLAYTDHLTNIPNRLQFVQTVETLIMESIVTHSKFAILYVDLDDFKLVNDRYGHDIGDKLIIRFTRMLDEVCKNAIKISRIGGDEFLILDSFESDNDIIDLARLIIKLLDHAIVIDNISINLSLSIGIAKYPSNGTTVDELIAKADAAMYDAKQLGKNGISFSKKK